MSHNHAPGVRKLTIEGLCQEVVQRCSRRPTHRYCFLLGAGASAASGIPSGETLAKEWLAEAHTRQCFNNQTLDEWAKQKFGPEFDHEHPGERYSDIYDLRFGDDRNDGYAHLETLMEGKEPSIGYSYLGYILSETRHNVAITTNFDNLIADSVSIYGQKFPIVLADDSLAYYATTELRRPLVAKIHGGLGFAPKNSAADISRLPEQWGAALNKIFDSYEPIVVGYAGNDGSLMDWLQSLSGRRLHWCLRTPHAKLDETIGSLPDRVKRLSERHSVNFVPIDGFDHLMAALWNALAHKHPEDFPDLLDALKSKQERRVAAHEDQRAKLFGGDSFEKHSVTTTSTPVDGNGATRAVEAAEGSPALKALVGEEGARRDLKPWWRYMEEIDTIKDVDAKDAAFRAAMEELPQSSQLECAYADFLTRVRKRDTDAEAHYKRSVELSPKDARCLISYATFLAKTGERNDEAEAHYQRAIAADGSNAFHLTMYAHFLWTKRNRADEAEVHFKRAIEVESNDAFSLKAYATFLERRGRMEEAESCYTRATEANPNYGFGLNAYALFLQGRGRMKEAESYHKRTIEADPTNAWGLVDYAKFLSGVVQRYDDAETYYKRAIEADPTHATSLRAYATFLRDIRGRTDDAKIYFNRAEMVS